tara:strand:+ start:2690 stop:4216 length:1527 start_codon:yes stop_codon:yes gene_type:complete
MQDSIEVIKKIENKIKPSDFIVSGVNIWPLYRFYIADKFRVKSLNIPSSNLTGEGETKNIFFVISAMFKGLISNIRLITTIKRKDVVFLSHSNFQRFSLDDQMFDPYCYPVMEELNKIGLSSEIYQVGVSTNTKQSYKKTINVEEAVTFWYFLLAPFMTLAAKFKTFVFHKNRLSLMVNKAIMDLNYDFTIPNDSFFIERSARLTVKSWFFEYLIKRHKAKFGVLVGYGTQSGLAFNLACSKKGVKTIELQHGMVSQSLPRYYGWTNVPSKGYEFLPDVFWCWNKSEVSSVYEWTNKATKHRALPHGNIYLQQREKYASQQSKKIVTDFRNATNSFEKICLVTLQAPNVEPDWLLEAILASPPSTFWLFKFHPADLKKASRISKIKNYFNKKDLDNFDLEFANNPSLNIYDCIDVADNVVSAFSSTLLEALMLNKIPVVIHSEGLVHYSNYVSSGEMLYLENPDDFLRYFSATKSNSDNLANLNLGADNKDSTQSVMQEIFTKGRLSS